MLRKRLFPSAMFLGLLLAWCAGSTCWAHGARCLRVEGTLGVQATYDNGKPFVEAEVLVFAPDDEQRPWQTGKTDQLGRFFFVPDAAGSWMIRITDSEGHAASNRFAVADRATGGDVEASRGTSRATRVLMGLAMVFGLFGIYSLVRRR